MSPSSSGLLKNYFNTDFKINLLNSKQLKMFLKCYLTKVRTTVTLDYKYRKQRQSFFLNKKILLINNFSILFYFLLIMLNSILLSCESHKIIVSAIHNNNYDNFLRVRRETTTENRSIGTESLLTVEWEGIQSGDHPDSSIRGFIVEYRAEKESQWNVHSGVIPYKGPNHQYRVQIPRLPTGISYFVRIKVLGEKNEVLVETPEIRARNEIVSIKCETDEITAPRDVDVKERGQFGVALAWLPPECGSVGEYQIELRGRHSQNFDVHRQTVAQPSASITGLLSGTEYSVRIRAVDRARMEGPWNEELVTVSTKGEVPKSSSDISVEYKSNNDARIHWKHFDDERLQHYEVILTDLNKKETTQRIERTRIAPTQNSFYFSNLKPNNDYGVGVVPYVDHEPRSIYRTSFQSAIKQPELLNVEPVIVKENLQHYQIHWKTPEKNLAKKFIIEYRLRNSDEDSNQKWLRASEDRSSSADEVSYSIGASVDELSNAFSVRIIFVADNGIVLARTKESLIAQGDEAACNSIGGIVRGITVDSTINTLTFTWKRPDCDETKEKIVGYEYSIWKQENGAPPEATTYTEKPSILIEDLPSQTVFLFRIRIRLENSHSPWSKIIEGLTVEKENGENIYHMRIVFSPPKSYLVWTPLPDHHNNIANFKLSYKHSAEDEWKQIIKPPTEFRCPKNIAEANDFCYDLQDLEYGKQYTSKLVYELHNSEWTSDGSPLLFILIEAEKTGLSYQSQPLNLRVNALNSTSIEVRWLPPESNAQIDSYEVSVKKVKNSNNDATSRVFYNKVSGSLFSHVFNYLSPLSTYNITVQAISNEWNNASGKPAFKIFNFPKEIVEMAHLENGAGGGFDDDMNDTNLQILNLVINEVINGKIALSWQISGDPLLVRAYQIEQKTKNNLNWHPASGYISNIPGQQNYFQQIEHSSLSSLNAILRVRAIGLDGQAIVVSAPIELNLECDVIPEAPTDVILIRKSGNSAVLRWSYPNISEKCDLYFIINGTIENVFVQQIVDGRNREHQFNKNPSRHWRLQIRANNKIGAGPLSQLITLSDVLSSSQRSKIIHDVSHLRNRRAICDPRTDFWCRTDSYSIDTGNRSLLGVLISTPQVQQEGSVTKVKWRSLGNGRGVFGYRVFFRTQNTRWNPFGQIVPYFGDNEDYNLVLTGLLIGLQYKIQIQALDRNSYVLYTTPEVSVRSSCQSPFHPPSHLSIDAPDSRHVRITWNTPPQSSWNCDSLKIEIQVDKPKDILPVFIDANGQTSYIFDAQPNSAWAVRARSVNFAGSSPWSASVTTLSATDVAESLIEGPFVTLIMGSPHLSWRSRLNTDSQIIDYFVVEWKTSTSPTWNVHQNKIQYSGNQRPYTINLTNLPKGHTYEVRVKAVGHNFETAFVSSSVMLQSSQQCISPPHSPPRNVEVNPLGPTQIQLRWQLLPEKEWNCDRVWYVIRYSSPESQGYRNLTNGEYSTIFESKPYTQWQFEIQAANPAGASAWSRIQTSKTLTTAPGPVTDLNVNSFSGDSVQLSWRSPQNPNGQVMGYEITYQLISRGMCENVANDRIITLFSDRPSFTLTQLQPHSKYRIGIAARTNIAGERLTKEIQTEQSVPTSGPAHIRVDNVAESSADLSWHPPPCIKTNGDISEYEYEITTVNRQLPNSPQLSDLSRSTRVSLHDLIPGTKYTAKVRAYTSRGHGPWSPEVNFETARGGTASAPISLDHNAHVVTSKTNDAHLVWQTTPQTSGYYDKFTCRFRPSNSPQAPVQERTFPALSPCDEALIRQQQLPPSTPKQQTHCGRIDGLRPDQFYDFQVAVKSKNSQWTNWSPPKKMFIGEEPIQITSITKLGGTSTSLQFSWIVRPTDQSRSSVFRITIVPLDHSEQPRIFNVDRNTFQYHVDNLKPKTTYSVTIEGSTNNVYYPGRSVDMTTDAEQIFNIEQRPKIIEEKTTSISIAWDVPSSIQCSSFIIEYKLENSAWQRDERRVPCDRGRQTYTAVVLNLPTNSVVDFRVIGVSLQNQPSTPSPEVRGHTKCSAPENPPQALSLDAPSTNEVKVSWARPVKNTWNCDQLNIDIGYHIGNGPEKIITVSSDKTDHLFLAEPSSRWTVRIRSANQAGTSPWSSKQSISTRQGAPGIVRELQLKPLSPNEIRVSWFAPSEQRGPIVGYDISYRLKHRLACQDEEPRDVSRDFLTVYNYKDIDYTLSGLLPNSFYEVRVRARTTELGPEESKEAATLQQPPSAPPFNLQLIYALERSLSFQWEPVDCSQRHGEIINYEYEIVGQDDWAKLERQIANTSNTRIIIDGLTPFTKYVMRVKAYNNIGGGPNTENLDVMTAKANAPLPPQDLVVTQEGTDFFIISWLPPYPPYGPHDSYKIRYQLLNENTWQHLEVSTKDPRLECPAVVPRFCFNITELDNGQQYRVQVAARIKNGSYGPYSSAIIANTLQILPDAPQAIELIAKTDHSLHIRWIPPVDLHGHITQYKLTYQSVLDSNSRRETINHPQIDYLIDNLLPETIYNISLSAGTKRGFGPEIWTRYTTNPFQVPLIVEAPIVTPEGAHTLNVEWNGVTEAKNRINGYIIELRAGDNPVWSEYGAIVKHEIGKRIYYSKLTSLDADTLYFVRIKVVDNRQRISDASPETQTRTGCAAPISPPTNINLQSPQWHQVKVNWQSPSKSSWFCSSIRYRIEFTNGTQPIRQIKVSRDHKEHTFDSGPITKWTIRIRTENDAGSSGWSDVLHIKTLGGAPSAVTDLQVHPTGPTSSEVTWRAPVDSNGEISGYTIVYQLRSIGECGPSTAKPITIHSKEERINLNDLIPDVTYDVFVIAQSTQQGPKSKVVTFRTEENVPSGPPKNLRVSSVTGTRAELMWNEIDCELRNGKIVNYNYELESLSPWSSNISLETQTHRVSLDTLTPFTKYRARVRGQNSQGFGPFTEYTAFQTLPAAPPSPTDLREEELLPHAIEISFFQPTPPNGILDLYRVRFTLRNQFNYKEIKVPVMELECSDSAKRDRLCYRISKLEPEQEYEVQVAAHTERGDWSDWSESLFTKTEKQNIPVLEQGLELDFAKSTSIGVKWHGLSDADAKHIVGYVLEYKSEDINEWQEHNDMLRHRSRQNNYKVVVRNLIESTEYFFRLRVVGKNDKRGSPGPELKAVTKCGKPEQPPSNVKIESIDFETVRFIWDNPEEETWRCDAVELLLQYSNSTSQDALTIPVDEASTREIIFTTVPGTRWEGKMRTQTVEEDTKPNYSKWSNRATFVTKSAPSEIFVKVFSKGPTKGEVNWDLPESYKDWKYGVNILYRPVKIGGCKNAEIEKIANPIILENVDDKQVFLENLLPGTEYEVEVTLRPPPGLSSSANFSSKKTVRLFKTEDSIPTGAPRSLRVENRLDTKLSFSWEPPECIEQNGDISQYEYEVTGLDDWNKGINEGTSPRTKIDITNLLPGSLYRFRVRAFTSIGPGPWSEPIDARTTGSEIGAPRELTAVSTRASSTQMTWLPPYPETSTVIAYRLRYSPITDNSRPVQIEVSGDELSCFGFTSPILTPENLCTTVNGLQPSTTYRFSVQAQSSSGNWGPWSSDYFSTTRQNDDSTLGGTLRLLSAEHDNLKVKWNPPAVISENIDEYQVFISIASKFDQNPKKSSTPGSQTTYYFKELDAAVHYNVTVQGLSQNKKLWFISGIFATTDITQGYLSWLTAPTELRLIEKSDTMLHVTWNPPEIFEPEHRNLLTHYRVTIAPLNKYTMEIGPIRNYTVKVPGNSIRFDDLQPETIYNITVQGGTDIGYGEIIWGSWSTLPTSQIHILRLKERTPTTLTVEWDPVWGTAHNGYILTAKSLVSIYSKINLNTIKTYDINPTTTEFVIGDLDPATTYNVTLHLKDQDDGAWGVYSTLPPGWYLPKNLKHCDRTNFATSMSWEPVDLNLATHYQVRYIHLNQQRAIWTEEVEKHKKYLLCPKDPCNRLCYLIFNLPNNPDEYAFQVRAKVNGIWNRWKMTGRLTVNESPEVKENCCIVPPPYHVDNIGHPGTLWEVPVEPAATEQNITRYYVVVDERDPSGETNWTLLTDKVTANRKGIPYYVSASFNIETMMSPTTIKLGDGTVIGGYLNYPLVKGKTYNYEIYTKWMLHDNQPVIASLRATPYLTAGWPWWWLLLLLLLLLFCILLTCLLLWCLQGRRLKKRHAINSQHVPLLTAEKGERFGGRSDFEDGYSHGYRDADRVGSGNAARRRLHDDYGQRDNRFHEGYAKGLRDAGFNGMSTSMSDLAQKPNSKLGYSSGYMQGFRDGNSGIFGNCISNSLLKRLEEQYPNNDEFKQGYIDGFKDGVFGGRTFEDSRRLQKSLTELTERLTSIEKTKGDEIHSTKIYHVYNQHPDVVGYSSTGEHLTQEIDELATGSATRRSTLRRHYTPGDYLKYESDFDGYNSLGRNRRSLSASALARESNDIERQRHLSGTSYISRASGLDKQAVSDSYSSKRYNYRSRSDVGSPRSYASQTLLDGARPGPTTPHSRKDALQSLQRELDSLSRSPAGAGYSSDTAAMNNSTHESRLRQKTTRTVAGYDHDTTTAAKSSMLNSSALDSNESGQGVIETTTVTTTADPTENILVSSSNYTESHKSLHDLGEPTIDLNKKKDYNWPDDLIDIVNEPIDQTLSRMRRFSNSISNVERGTSNAGAASSSAVIAADIGEKQNISEKYHRSYKEEYSGGSH